MPIPQCLSCKARRVRCDSRKPTCSRCPREGIECPGYGKPTKWIIHDQSSTVLTRSRHRPIQSLGSTGVSEAKLKKKRESKQVGPRQSSSRYTSNLHPLQNRSWSPLDDLALHLRDSISYYNGQIAPFLVPDESILEWSVIEQEDWQNKPDLIRQMLNLLCMQHKAIRCHKDLDLDLEVCKQRQQSIQALRELLSHPKTQTSVLTLDAILLLLRADIMHSAKDTWHAHVHGAAAIVDLRGGWQKYIDSSCDNYLNAFVFLSTAIIGGTTSSSKLLSESPTWPYSLVGTFPDWDEIAVTTCFPCPNVLFQAISGINHLRTALYQDVGPNTGARQADYNKSIQRLRSILHQIVPFSPSSWLSSLIGTVQLEFYSSNWLALIHCYHVATLLYCIRTLVLESRFRNDETLSSLLKDIFGTSVVETIRIGAVRALFQRLGCSFPPFSGPSLDPKSSAWNAVTWPLVIAGYEAGGISLAAEEARVMRKFVAQKMEKLATLLGRGSITDAQNILERCWERRGKGDGGGLDGSWMWDETFTERYIFVF